MKKIRDIPYGYTMRNGRTVIAQDEAAVIREIFSAYINGASLQSIAELLTERKIPYSERTDVWDKARIARIIGNAKYIGDGEYDPIIEEEQYEEAAAVKTARQRNTFEKNLEGIDLLRDLVRCAECGAPMRRRVSSKHRIRESWDCTNPDCGQRIRISDTHLLEKVTILMNRIIANSYLLIPRPKKRKELSAEAQRINREIDAELERDDPSDALIIVKTIEMAERLYAESDAHLQIAASIARKRVSLMTPQEEFSPAYFSDIAAYGEAIGLTGGTDEIDLLRRKIDGLNRKMVSLINESVESGEGIESHEAEFKELSDTIELLQGRIQKLEEALASDQVNDSRILQLQQIIADRASKKMEYDDTIVHQMIECVKVYPDGRLDIIFGGGYLIEERLEKES